MAGERPRVKLETKFEYRDKTTGEACHFKPADDEVVATFDSEASGEAAKALYARDDAAVHIVSHDQGFAVLRVGETSDATGVSAALGAADNLANSIPVMVDGDGGRRYFLPDELTVQFKESVDPAKAEQILSDEGVDILMKQRTPGYFTVAVPEGKGLFASIGALAKLKEVAFAEPSEFGIDDLLATTKKAPVESKVIVKTKIVKAEDADDLEDFDEAVFDEEDAYETDDVLDLGELDIDADLDVEALPTDTHFGKLWGLRNVAQTVNGTSGSTDADIDADAAWSQETGRRNVIVAVIDTGCDLDHPDLQANILPRGSEDWDFADPSDNVPWDANGHGTHVAGTVAARRNGRGVVGVAYGARLMPLRINLMSGRNQNRADAINYVTQQAIRFRGSRRYVINCSWRMSGDHAGVRTAIQRAVANNVVVVFAAGNANSNTDVFKQYPGVYPEVIAVAATDQRDVRATFSNYGKNVDVSAPGVNIYSTIPNNTYGFKNGTSMAAPHTAGLAALIWSKNSGLRNYQVRRCIERTCDNIDAKNPTKVGLLGKGRINAYRALRHTPAPRLPYRILRKFRFPQINAGSSTGLTFVPSFPLYGGARPVLLFLTQKAGSERIHFLNPATGAPQRSIDPVANDTIGSLGWDGKAIRVANVTTGAGSINRINPFTGAQTSSIPAPSGRGEGLVVVGARIFYSTINRIYELRASTGQVLRSFPAPGGQCRALTYGRGLLFSANSATGTITAFHPFTLQVRGTFNAPGAGSRQAEGLAFDRLRRILYVANQSENQIYAIRVLGI